MEEMVKVLFMTNLVVMRRRSVYYSIAALLLYYYAFVYRAAMTYLPTDVW